MGLNPSDDKSGENSAEEGSKSSFNFECPRIMHEMDADVHFRRIKIAPLLQFYIVE